MSVGFSCTGVDFRRVTPLGTARWVSGPLSSRTITHVFGPTGPALSSIGTKPSSSSSISAKTASVLFLDAIAPGATAARSETRSCARKPSLCPPQRGHFIAAGKSGLPPRRVPPSVAVPPGTSRAPGSASAAILAGCGSLSALARASTSSRVGAASRTAASSSASIYAVAGTSAAVRLSAESTTRATRQTSSEPAAIRANVARAPIPATSRPPPR